MSETPSPLRRLMQTEGFKPFSGPHAFRVLEKAKARLDLEKVDMNDLLLAVSSLGLLLETEMALIYALQDQICTKCGKCCTDNTSLKAQKEELKRIAAYKNLSYKKLKKRTRARPRKDGTMRVTRRPCPFYDDGCSVYDIRPGVCRAYPTNKLLAALAGGYNQYPENCEIADDLLAELVIKRALEEKMYRENPELMMELAEKKREEMTRLAQMTQTQRLQFLVNRYQKNLQEP
jgi:Fe-S-cluster containining protein